jgi:hypothetical protein
MLPFGSSAVADTEDSELLALRALGFLSSARSGLSRLAQRSGLKETDFARRPLMRAHLAAVLDFMITDEDLLVAFSRAVEVSPETVYEARRLLRLGPIAAEAFIPANRPEPVDAAARR